MTTEILENRQHSFGITGSGSQADDINSAMAGADSSPAPASTTLKVRHYMIKAAILRRHLTDDQRTVIAVLWARKNKVNKPQITQRNEKGQITDSAPRTAESVIEAKSEDKPLNDYQRATKAVEWNRIKTQVIQAKDIIIMGKLNYSLEAIQKWAKQSKQSLETQNEIAEYRSRLNRAQGLWIEENIPEEGGNPQLRKKAGLEVYTLSDVGIDEHDSRKFRMLANLWELIKSWEKFPKTGKFPNVQKTSTTVLLATDNAADGIVPQGRSIYTNQIVKRLILRVTTRCSQILGGLLGGAGQLHTLKTGILTAAAFVISKLSYKKQQLTETFREGDRNNRPTEALGNL